MLLLLFIVPSFQSLDSKVSELKIVKFQTLFSASKKGFMNIRTSRARLHGKSANMSTILKEERFKSNYSI